MKVLIIASYPLSGEINGAMIHVYKLLQYISQLEGIEVHVITFGNGTKELSENNIHIHIFAKNLIYIPFLFPFLLRKIEKKIDQISPDIIHTIGSVPYSILGAIFSPKYPSTLTIIRLIMKEIQTEINTLRAFRKKLLIIPLERIALKRFSHIIVQSNFTKDQLHELIDGNSKVYVVPEGVEISCIYAASMDEIKRYESDIFIAVALRRLKGLDILINAISLCKEKFPDIKVIIAGSGPDEKSLKDLVRYLNLNNNIKFVGFLSSSIEIKKYYSCCKFVVVPSRLDIEPFAPLDGAMCGKPSIVSKACNSSIIDDGITGFLVESENTNEFADKIKEFMANSHLRETMGVAAREKAKEYDWQIITEMVISVYNDTIKDFNNQTEKFV